MLQNYILIESSTATVPTYYVHVLFLKICPHIVIFLYLGGRAYFSYPWALAGLSNLFLESRILQKRWMPLLKLGYKTTVVFIMSSSSHTLFLLNLSLGEAGFYVLWLPEKMEVRNCEWGHSGSFWRGSRSEELRPSSHWECAQKWILP